MYVGEEHVLRLVTLVLLLFKTDKFQEKKHIDHFCSVNSGNSEMVHFRILCTR